MWREGEGGRGGGFFHQIVKKGGSVLCRKENKGEAPRPHPAAAGRGGGRGLSREVKHTL